MKKSALLIMGVRNKKEREIIRFYCFRKALITNRMSQSCNRIARQRMNWNRKQRFRNAFRTLNQKRKRMQNWKLKALMNKRILYKINYNHKGQFRSHTKQDNQKKRKKKMRRMTLIMKKEKMTIQMKTLEHLVKLSNLKPELRCLFKESLPQQSLLKSTRTQKNQLETFLMMNTLSQNNRFQKVNQKNTLLKNKNLKPSQSKIKKLNLNFMNPQFSLKLKKTVLV